MTTVVATNEVADESVESVESAADKKRSAKQVVRFYNARLRESIKSVKRQARVSLKEDIAKLESEFFMNCMLGESCNADLNESVALAKIRYRADLKLMIENLTSEMQIEMQRELMLVVNNYQVIIGD